MTSESISIRSAIEKYPLEVISRRFGALWGEKDEISGFPGTSRRSYFKGIGQKVAKPFFLFKKILIIFHDFDRNEYIKSRNVRKHFVQCI